MSEVESSNDQPSAVVVDTERNFSEDEQVSSLKKYAESLASEQKSKEEIESCLLTKSEFVFAWGEEKRELISEIADIASKYLDGFCTISLIDDDAQETHQYFNSFKKGIYKEIVKQRFDQSAGELKFKSKKIPLTNLYIKHIEVIENPDDLAQESFSIQFKNCKSGKIVNFENKSISEIIAATSNRRDIKNSKIANDALKSLITEIIDDNKADFSKRINVTGFYEIDGILHFNQTEEYKVKLSDDLRNADVLDAVEVLHELLEFYNIYNNDNALVMLYYIIQAPLGYIRKKIAGENRILFLFGEAHTGKGLFCDISMSLWGQPQTQTMRGGSQLTCPQLATSLNRTTFPIIIDEIRNQLENQTITELLKSSTTGFTIHERTKRDLTGMDSFYAYASPILTTNVLPGNLPQGMYERLIPVEFTVENKHENTDYVKKYESFKKANSDKLSILGSFLKQMFLENWDGIREIILDNDCLESGKQILEMMYLKLNIEPPTWLRTVEAEDCIEHQDDYAIFMDFVINEINSQCRNFLPMPRHDDGISDWRELSIQDRVDRLQESKIKISFIPFVGRDNLYFTKDVIDEIRRKRNVEISQLNNLKFKFPATYKVKFAPQRNKRVLHVPFKAFEDYLNYNYQTTI